MLFLITKNVLKMAKSKKDALATANVELHILTSESKLS